MKTPDYKGHKSLAEMIRGHIYNWRCALESLGKVQLSDDNITYVQHELKALKEIGDAVDVELNNPPIKTASEMLYELMGSVQDGSDVTLSLFQDDATKSYHLIARSGNQTIWSEHADSFSQVVQQAYHHNVEIV